MKEGFFLEYPDLVEDITSPPSSVDSHEDAITPISSNNWLLDVMYDMPSAV